VKDLSLIHQRGRYRAGDQPDRKVALGPPSGRDALLRQPDRQGIVGAHVPLKDQGIHSSTFRPFHYFPAGPWRKGWKTSWGVFTSDPSSRAAEQFAKKEYLASHQQLMARARRLECASPEDIPVPVPPRDEGKCINMGPHRVMLSGWAVVY